MSDIWQYFQSLFQKTEESSQSQPLLHDNIERSNTELLDYETWKSSWVKGQLLQWIQEQYGTFLKEGTPNDQSILFLDTPSSKGFAIQFFKLRYNAKEIHHLFDYFKEKILLLDYKAYSSDVRTYTKGSIVESLARHYLKPSLKNMLGNPPFNQEFGNISIELICQDDSPKTLRFSATTYHDRSYQKPKHFGELMRHLVN
ncbi:MAG: hypothetical protein AAF960_17030 [Bacteroidota bacterium]